MIRFVKAYQDFCSQIHNSLDYKNADSKEQENIDKYLLSQEVVETLIDKYIPSLDLSEDMSLAFLNSREGQKNIAKINRFVSSNSSQNFFHRLESLLCSLPKEVFGR